MPHPSLDAATRFLAVRRLAIVGLSRQPQDFTRAMARELVHDLCPFMALPGASFPHRLHGFIRSRLGGGAR